MNLPIKFLQFLYCHSDLISPNLLLAEKIQEVMTCGSSSLESLMTTRGYVVMTI